MREDTPSPVSISVGGKFGLGDRVRKTKGSSWQGRVVGFYSTELTPIGYAVESEREPGSVQIYPESALAALAPAADWESVSLIQSQNDQLRKALEPFALMSTEGVVSQVTNYSTIKTISDYFHSAARVLAATSTGGTE